MGSLPQQVVVARPIRVLRAKFLHQVVRFLRQVVKLRQPVVIVAYNMKSKNHFSMQWHITDRCDQRCKHCYIFAGEDKETDELDVFYLIRKL